MIFAYSGQIDQVIEFPQFTENHIAPKRHSALEQLEMKRNWRRHSVRNQSRWP